MSNRARSVLALAAVLLPLSASAQTPAPAAPAEPPPQTPPPATPPALTPPPSEAPPAALPPAETPASAAVAEPAPGLPSEPPPAVAVPAPAPPAAEPAPGFPPKLAVGTEGVFQPGVLLQAWFLIDRADETTDTFRLRRAELAAKGEIVPKLVSYGLMADFAKVLEPGDKQLPVANQDPAPSDPDEPESVTAKQPVSPISALQDFMITFQSEYVDATIGQYKIPVSYEGSATPSSKLLFAERGLVARQYGDRRDLGLKLSKAFKYFGYTAGVWNGAGQNNLDNNPGKELGLRLEVYPIEGLLIGGVAYGTVGQRDQNGAKDRFEADLRFERDAFLFLAEYINARDVIGGAKIKGHGFQAMVGYAFLDQTLQPVVRVGYLDPNTDVDLQPMNAGAADELFHVDLGLNYYIRKNEAKVLLNYLRQQYQDKKPNNEVVFAAQVAF